MIGSPPAFFVASLQFPQQKQQIRTHDQSAKGSDYIVLVELRGIEPLSESNLTGLSPGAVCYLHSLGAAGADTLRALVAS